MSEFPLQYLHHMAISWLKHTGTETVDTYEVSHFLFETLSGVTIVVCFFTTKPNNFHLPVPIQTSGTI
jgi:hypothetical protein